MTRSIIFSSILFLGTVAALTRNSLLLLLLGMVVMVSFGSDLRTKGRLVGSINGPMLVVETMGVVVVVVKGVVDEEEVVVLLV